VSFFCPGVGLVKDQNTQELGQQDQVQLRARFSLDDLARAGRGYLCAAGSRFNVIFVVNGERPHQHT